VTAIPAFSLEGLWAALSRLDRVLERAAAAADAAYGGGASAEPYRGLYISSEDTQRTLSREPGSTVLAGAGVESPETMPPGSRFPWLAERFELTPFDVDVLLLALAPEVDLRYERVYAYLQDDVTRRRPTVDLALSLLCATRDARVQARARFTRESPLVRHELIHVAGEGGPVGSLLSHAIRPDETVIRFLLGGTELDARLAAFGNLDAYPEAGSSEVPRAEELIRAARAAREAKAKLHVYLEGAGKRQKRIAAETLAARLGQPLLTFSVSRALASPDVDGALSLAFREAELFDAVLYLEEVDALRGDERRGALEALYLRLGGANRLVVLEGLRAVPPRLDDVATVLFPEPDFAERRTAWAVGLEVSGVETDDAMLDELASRYRLGTDEIGRAARNATRSLGAVQRRPTLPDIMRAARLEGARDVGVLARKVTAKSGWNDLVLPPDQLAQLREVCQQARYRHVVFGAWGFDDKLSLGKGLSALFSGPPGTGKTMAAEVIATDLGLELYKIDLSQVVSKYIGETEKNIDRLFGEARAANAILFFDECDALFGKRTQVQDAHDRYANIEISYLLQKMDEHDGLTILATNLRDNLDAAFIRRLTFIVEFPFPDESSRRRIWSGIWPKKVPRNGNLDLDFMASQFTLAGGAVKNIAVAASFLAAAEADREVTTVHLLRATRRELEKVGRTVPRTEFGPYADKMPESRGRG